MTRCSLRFVLFLGLAGAAFARPEPNAPLVAPVLVSFDQAGGFGGEHATITPGAEESGPVLRARFEASPGYPAVVFPAPAGGWNLSAYEGIEVELRNSGTTTLMLGLRVDNADPGEKEPWRYEEVTLAPGERKTLETPLKPFKGVPGYKLDPARISAVRIYAARPVDGGDLVISNLRPVTIRSGGANAPSAERTRLVAPPAWLGQRPPVEGDWILTLDENFEGTALNEKVWSTQLTWNGFLPTWKARYSKDNVKVKDGLLELLVEQRTGPAYDDPRQPTRDITSGLICSFGKFTQAYGYFEARIKLPEAPGLWPAFWMMPDRGPGREPRESTASGGMEFDILEHLTEWGKGRYNAAVHWGDYGKEHKSWANNNIYHGPTADGWHTWGMLWEPGRVTWYCDGAKKAVFENPAVGTVPGYLILNVQAGGWAKAPIDPARLPDRMLVDYVRVWQTRDRLPH